MVETFSTPHTQRLLAALIEERIPNTLPKNGDNGVKVPKIKRKYVEFYFLSHIITTTSVSDLTKLKTSATNQKVGTCLDRRLKKELVEQGILSIDDLTKVCHFKLCCKTNHAILFFF